MKWIPVGILALIAVAVFGLGEVALMAVVIGLVGWAIVSLNS